MTNGVVYQISPECVKAKDKLFINKSIKEVNEVRIYSYSGEKPTEYEFLFTTAAGPVRYLTTDTVGTLDRELYLRWVKIDISNKLPNLIAKKFSKDQIINYFVYHAVDEEDLISYLEQFDTYKMYVQKEQ